MEKEIKVVCLDLNDTLIKERTWPNLNLAMGMTPEEDEMFYKLHKNGDITYTMWLNIALGIYKNRNNLKREDIEGIINSYNYLPFAKQLVNYLKKKYTVVLVSGAMGLLVKKVAKELSIEHYKSLTEFFFDADGYITNVSVDDRSGDEAKNKVCFLEEFCAIFGVKLENCVCIGDGDNDHQLFQRTRGITFSHAKEAHKSLAWKIVRNLNEIRKIL